MKRMLKTFTTSLTVLIFASFGFAQVDDLNGRWTATLKRGDETGTAVMTLHVSGSQVAGTLSEPSGQILQIENGKLEGQHLTFDVSAREHGHSKSIHFFGDVSTGEIVLHNESNGKQGLTMTFHRSND